MIRTNEFFENVIKNDADECSNNWIEFLCSLGNEHHYQKISMVSKSEVLAIMKYRRELRNKGFGNVSLEELIMTYEEKDDNKLHRLLEVLFLESLTKQQFDLILDKINKAEGNMTTFYNKHMCNMNKLALTIALEL